MKPVICWLPSVLLLSVCWSEESTKTDDCKCVPYFTCHNNTIVGDGAGIIHIRPYYRRAFKRSADLTMDLSEDSNKCESYLEICCGLPKESPSGVVPTAKSPAKRKKCTAQPKHQNVGSDTRRTKNNEFPWTVAVLKKDQIDTIDESRISYQCGGTLIHPQIVLTAAHCVNDENPSILQVRAGKWLAKNTSQPRQDHQVQNVIVHENFDKHSLHNDFGLLILQKPVDLTDVNVNVVYLAETNENFDNSRCISNGWGKKLLTEEDQAALKRIELPVVANNQCQKAFRTTTVLGEYFKLDDSFICAGGELGRDTCEYDGGHPLVCPMKGNSEKYVQVGIVAWGIDCGEDGLAGVYANVAYARKWIDEKVAKAGYNLDEYQCIP